MWRITLCCSLVALVDFVAEISPYKVSSRSIKLRCPPASVCKPWLGISREPKPSVLYVFFGGKGFGLLPDLPNQALRTRAGGHRI